jgi:OOP family OmpA-OmpF porin
MLRNFIPFVLVLSVLCNCYAQDEPPNYLLRSIYFGGGSYYIDSLQTEQLYQFIDSIPDIRRYIISIHSHTDNIGGAAYNQWLSQMRSQSAIETLVEKEIRREDITVKDFGPFNPVFDNSTPEGRMKNRRVDIIFWPITL